MFGHNENFMAATVASGFVSDELDRDPSRDLWETHADWWIEGFTEGVDAEYEEQILPLAAQELGDARTILDIGCGDGQISRMMASVGAHVVGIDPTWNQIRVAQERAGGADYLRATASEIPFANASFDAAVACLVFEHIDAVDAAIEEVARVIKPGGRFCFFLNHPLLQTPGSGWIDDHIIDPPEQSLDTLRRNTRGVACKPFDVRHPGSGWHRDDNIKKRRCRFNGGFRHAGSSPKLSICVLKCI